MADAITACGVAHIVLSPSAPVPDLVVKCQRVAGHRGLHCATWINGYIEWPAE